VTWFFISGAASEKDNMAKIIIVDDSETIRRQLVKVLEGVGHRVVQATDGIVGLEAIKNNKDAALIFCDVNMPNMDGITMCERVHEIAEISKIPIFMLTTESNVEMKAKGKAAGVLAWIVKPFDEDKLLAAVKKIVPS